MTVESLTLFKGAKGFELQVAGKENWVLLRDGGYSPVQSIAAAAGACGGYVYQSILENSKIPYTFHKVEVSYLRHEEKKSHPIKQIELVFYVTVAKEQQGRAERGIRLVSKHCPVIQSLDPAIEILEKVVFV